MSFSTIPVPNYVKSILILIVQDKLKVILSKIWDVLILMRKFNLILVKIHSEVPEKKLKVHEGRRTAHDDGRQPIAIGHLCGTDDVNNFVYREA